MKYNILFGWLFDNSLRDAWERTLACIHAAGFLDAWSRLEFPTGYQLGVVMIREFGQGNTVSVAHGQIASLT